MEEESRNKWGERRDWKVVESGGRVYRIHLIIPYTVHRTTERTIPHFAKDTCYRSPVTSPFDFASLHLSKVPPQSQLPQKTSDFEDEYLQEGVGHFRQVIYIVQNICVLTKLQQNDA